MLNTTKRTVEKKNKWRERDRENKNNELHAGKKTKKMSKKWKRWKLHTKSIKVRGGLLDKRMISASILNYELEGKETTKFSYVASISVMKTSWPIECIVLRIPVSDWCL